MIGMEFIPVIIVMIVMKIITHIEKTDMQLKSMMVMVKD
jgi:hypothetical protein